MKFPLTPIPKLWKDSAVFGSTFIAIVASIVAVAGFSIDNIFIIPQWWIRLAVILFVYVIVVSALYVILSFIAKKGITIKTNGISVNIKQGDLFKANGWKVIPFNEYYDTTVNEVIIASSTLNGIFIKEHVEDFEKLQEAIVNADESMTSNKKIRKGKRFSYPLGRIIPFEDYMLLAFSHFNEQNVAYISKPDYEHCLLKMWKEVRRTYAGIPIFLPLIGSGITSFEDIPQKSNLDLLKCMICTLRASGQHINQPITILLTKEVMQDINLYEVKGVI